MHIDSETTSCQHVAHLGPVGTFIVWHRELGENMTDEELQEMIDEAGTHVSLHRILSRDSARLTGD